MKKLFLILFVILCAGLGWYLFLKKYDYQFNLEVEHSPGSVYREIYQLDKLTGQSGKEEIQIIDNDFPEEITHRITYPNSAKLNVHWEFQEQQDSTTSVKISFTDTKHTLKNRIDILNPFTKSTFVDSLEKRFITFGKNFRDQQETYRIRVEDEFTSSPSAECVCVSSGNIEIDKKALEMLRNITILQDYFALHDLKMDGYPMVKVNSIDKETDRMNFDFCFPVKTTAGLQEGFGVTFRKLQAERSMKAVFNGNYRSSHLAWYEMMYKAEKWDKTIDLKPLEVFHNNPNVEQDALNWVAEIYMPSEE